jgi:hypothetical protein
MLNPKSQQELSAAERRVGYLRHHNEAYGRRIVWLCSCITQTNANDAITFAPLFTTQNRCAHLQYRPLFFVGREYCLLLSAPKRQQMVINRPSTVLRHLTLCPCL